MKPPTSSPDGYAQLLAMLSGMPELSDANKQTCRQLFTPRHYHRKDTLLNSGEVWRNVFFIVEGALRLFYSTTDGREFNKGFYFERQFAWPIAPFARHEPSRFTIAALEDTDLLVADFQGFMRWLQQIDRWQGFALAHAESLAEEKVLREEEFLLDSAEQRYINFTTEFADQLGRIPDYHIASYLGITNVSLSRIKKKIARS